MRGAVLVLTLSVVTSVMVGPWPGAVAGTPTFYRTDTSPEFLDALRGAVALVPADAPVARPTGRVAPGGRRYLLSVPVLGRAEWIVIDVSDAWIPEAFGGRCDPDALRRFTRSSSRAPTGARSSSRRAYSSIERSRSEHRGRILDDARESSLAGESRASELAASRSGRR